MKKNIGIYEKIIRLGIALILGVLFYFKILTGLVGMVSITLASILFITGWVDFCPIWDMLHINTIKTRTSHR